MKWRQTKGLVAQLCYRLQRDGVCFFFLCTARSSRWQQHQSTARIRHAEGAGLRVARKRKEGDTRATHNEGHVARVSMCINEARVSMCINEGNVARVSPRAGVCARAVKRCTQPPSTSTAGTSDSAVCRPEAAQPRARGHPGPRALPRQCPRTHASPRAWQKQRDTPG